MCAQENANYVFVDIQGFKVNARTFIVKEFCLINGECLFHYIVKSPISFNRLSETYRRQARYLTNHFHGLSFDCGDIAIQQLTEKIFPQLENKIVLVKGLQKVSWLKQIFQGRGEVLCINIESFTSIWEVKSHDEYEICDYHNRKFGWSPCVCAISNAIKLQENWILHLVMSESSTEQDKHQNGLVG